MDRETLLAVYRNSGRDVAAEGESLEGFVGRRGGHWVIYTLPPTYVDDSATRTLGHELMHIPLGEYH